MSSNTENIAVFCTGNKEYIPMMVASLGIVALKTGFHPWIITDAKDQETKDLLEKCNIGYIQQDLSEFFESDSINENWPSHSFWWAAGPEYLLDLGYKYSLFIDADIYCNLGISPEEFTDDLEIAACSYGDDTYNSGVIMFNNEKMREKMLWRAATNNFLGLTTNVFEKWHGGKVHDQQLLTSLKSDSIFGKFLGSSYDFTIKDLDVTWNYDWREREGINDQYTRKSYDELLEVVKFVHFANSKPWQGLQSGWGSKHHGLFKLSDNPYGWPEKEGKEPRPLTRIKFVLDWRWYCGMIEQLKGVKLFDGFESLDVIHDHYFKLEEGVEV